MLDLNENNLEMPPEVQAEIHKFPQMNDAVNYIYAILCALVKRGTINFHNPAALIDLMFMRWPSNIRGTKETFDLDMAVVETRPAAYASRAFAMESRCLFARSEKYKPTNVENLAPSADLARIPLTETTFDDTRRDS